MGPFNTNMTIVEILQRMNANDGNTEIIHAGPCFLQFKLHQELMNDQQHFQKKQLEKTAHIAMATWILAGATIVLALATIILIFVKK